MLRRLNSMCARSLKLNSGTVDAQCIIVIKLSVHCRSSILYPKCLGPQMFSTSDFEIFEKYSNIMTYIVAYLGKET
jgi:hypothetical protein